MSLLDDARRLADADSIDDGNYEYYRKCIYCGAQPDELPPTEYGYKGHPSEPHKPDCPWLSMPKIVAALEAAERLIMYTRHKSRCDIPQRNGPTCTCGLNDILEAAFPDALERIKSR